MKTKIPVEISARHIHLSKSDFEKLFGKNSNLISVKKLSQPEEFASEQKVTLINGNKRIEYVRVLGPFREKSHVEISLTDAYNLRLNPLPKIKISWDLTDTEKILVKGNKSSLKIPCIIANRHLHISSKEAGKLKLRNNQNISIKINGIRKTTFHNVVVRVSEKYKSAFHLDTDEGNSAGIVKKTFGEIVN